MIPTEAMNVTLYQNLGIARRDEFENELASKTQSSDEINRLCTRNKRTLTSCFYDNSNNQTLTSSYGRNALAL